ncbi:MAG: hypothetical protein JWO53_65, partial [Chlamydiia bacterium]|nr:hypothetical protein [Chlamydiia bacterium]
MVAPIFRTKTEKKFTPIKRRITETPL